MNTRVFLLAVAYSVVCSLAACSGPDANDGTGSNDDGSNDGGSQDDTCVPAGCPPDAECGTVPDGCGGQASCGSGCAGPMTCGGGGIANRCACATPDSDGDGYANVACGGDDCDDTAAAVHPGDADAGWSSTIVLSMPGSEGEDLAAQIDAAGDVHVAFNWTADDRSEQTLRYLRITPSGSVVGHELVHIDSSSLAGDVGRDLDLALDSAGVPHLVFVDQSRLGTVKLYEGMRDAGFWGFDQPQGNRETSLVLGPDGVAHVATGGIRYLTKPDVWHSDDIADGRRPAIAIDPQGVVHVVFGTETGLQHGVRGALGGWIFETIETVTFGAIDPDTRLHIDATGTLHVAYRTNAGVQYARKPAQGTWAIETAAGPTDNGPKSMLVLADGTVAIAYVQWLAPGGNTVRLAVRAPGGGWLVRDGDACGCYDVALVERQGELAAIYALGGNLALATFSVPDGVDADCDGVAW